ncbi:hypothetical protein FB645_002938 [Coemansia sp. IMI 203386]|nr:hypothetical protein FB645_002938 [Coemansia sp. IMI 203386]
MTLVKVLYFASARDAAKQKELDMIEIDDNDDGSQPTLQAVIEKVKSTYDKIAPVLETSAISYNEEYCDSQQLAEIRVKDNDEIAIIPPVSGG